jgi:predicted helicase
MTDENVHILDPFTGTGTFITRLLQSGIIKPKDLERKYTQEIHANEIILLAYYIASINIENVYHEEAEKIAQGNKDFTYTIEEPAALYVADSAGGGSKTKTNGKAKTLPQEEYTPFSGICLTDTFQLGETEEGEALFSEIFPQNSKRVQAQRKVPLRVIMSNPPYSIGQKSANDNAQNQSYPKLEARIQKSYIETSSANLNKAAYDTYIKAFRWASDRLDPHNGGIIGFVSNGSWLDTNGLDGFRKAICKEFSTIYVFNLRGNQRTSGELSKKEGGKIFGSDSRTPVSITIFVKNPNQTGNTAQILYKDIGDYLSREEKLNIVKESHSILNPALEMSQLKPNAHGDWLNKRNDKFGEFISLAPDQKFDAITQTFFSTYAIGVATNRDAWVYNYSNEQLIENMSNMINFYNKQTDITKKQAVELDNDPSKISWTRALRKDAKNNVRHEFEEIALRQSLYRPYCKLNLYFHLPFIEAPGIHSKLFPSVNVKNLLICVHGLGGKKDFSTIITDIIPDLNSLEAGAQCFPLYWYEKQEHTQGSLFEKVEDEYIRHDAVSDFILGQAQSRYGHRVEKEDVFYYVYGLLHSSEYRKTFANDLKKMLPRLPLVEKPADFWTFSRAGRELADLHLNYEDQKKPTEIKADGGGGGGGAIKKIKKRVFRLKGRRIQSYITPT